MTTITHAELSTLSQARNQRHSLDPRLTLSRDYVPPSLFLHITAWWLCPLNTMQLKRAKWSGHSFVFAPICWSVVALFRVHWSVQWQHGEGCASQAVVRGPDSETHHSAEWWVRRRCINSSCWCYRDEGLFSKAIQQRHLYGTSSTKNKPATHIRLHRATLKIHWNIYRHQLDVKH